MNRIETIHVATTTEKQTEPGRFEAALRSAADHLARGVVASVELAAPLVPGGTVLSAAVQGAVSGAGGMKGLGLSGGLTGHAGPLAAGAAAEGGEDDLLAATRRLQAEARTYNLQYLQLQEGLQRESREFSALSNVMKVKHDTARTAIQNIH
jgi:hypothetical protein